MNKTRIIQLSIGGIALLGAIVLGYLGMSAWSAKTEAEDTLDSLIADGERFSHLKVFPDKASLSAVEGNQRAYNGWLELARTTVAAGDRRYEKTTRPAFKAFLVEEAKRFSSRNGKINGRLVKADFGFGFDEYILKGGLPTEEDLPRLQREWGDVSTIIDIVSESGATSITDLQVVRKPAAEVEPTPKKNSSKKAQPKKGEPDPVITRIQVGFTGDAAALVKTLNALASDTRFIVVESLAFARETDEIAAKLGVKPNDNGESAKRGRGRRRATAVEETVEVETKGGVVTDPQQAVDLNVTMTVAVYDFRSAAEVGTDSEEEVK